MLPGFRFLFAAIMLSMSILVFGLGAAALLRAAHEEFASTPSWRAPPEPKFAQQNYAPNETQGAASEAPEAVLAMLRVEPEPALPKASDDIPAAPGPAEPAAVATPPDQAEKIAALTPQDTSPPETAKSDVPVPEMPVQSEAPANLPAPAEETSIAMAAQVSPPVTEAAAPTPEPAIVPPPAANTDLIALKIATLGGPAVTIEAETSVKAASAKPDRSAIKKKRQARRDAERRRAAALRARQAAQQRAAAAADPFAQPTTTARGR